MEAKDSRQFMSFLLFVQNSTEGEGGRKKKEHRDKFKILGGNGERHFPRQITRSHEDLIQLTHVHH